MQMGCNQAGNASIEKNVPESKNCGRVMILAIGGTELSFFAIPDTAKPNPIKTMRPRVDKSSISNTVKMPCISVKPKRKWPIRIINKAPARAKTNLLMASPRMIYGLPIGVAKNRLITRVCLKLKNTNAVPKTPELNKEKPSCPGKIKSIDLYSRP